MVTQRRTLVIGAESVPILQDGHHRVGELVESRRRDMRHQDEPVGRMECDSLLNLVRDVLRCAHERGPDW